MIADITEENESYKTDLAEVKAKTVVHQSELTLLRKRKEKEGTINKVKNLEVKNAKLKSSKINLKQQISILEASLESKEDELIVFARKDKASKKSIAHLQKDLLAASNDLKVVREQRDKLKIKLGEDEDDVENATENPAEESEAKSTKSESEDEEGTDDTKKTDVEKEDDESAEEKKETLPKLPTKDTATLVPIKGDSSNEDSESTDDEDFTIKKPSKKLPVPFKDGEELDELNEDDSFLNPPTTTMKIGKNLISNYVKKTSRDAAPPRNLRNSNTNNTVTVFNNQITFTAVRGSAKTTHDYDKYGTQACGLHPYCSNKLQGGEDIGLLYIISPVFHPNYEKNAWCCYYHAKASIDGIEVQTQKKALVTSTPKTSKVARTGADLTNAPMKKSTKKSKTQAEGPVTSQPSSENEEDQK